MKYPHLIPIFIVALFGSFAWASYRPILPVYVRILGGGGMLAGLLSSSFMLARGLSAFLFGKLSDILNKRAIFIRTGFLLFFFTTLFFLFAKSYPIILILVTLQGFLSGMIWPQAQTLIARGSSTHYRSRAFTIYFISGNAGMLLSSGAIGLGLSFLAKRGIKEPQSYFYIFAAIGLFFLLTLIFSFTIREFKKEAKETIEEKKIKLPFYLLIGMMIGNGIIMGLISSIFILYLYDRFGLLSKDIAYIFFSSQIIGLLLTYLVSHISDVKGVEWGLFLSQIPLSISCLFLPFLDTSFEVILCMIFLVFGLESFIPISRSIASMGEKVGTKIGLINTASNMGTVIGPLLGGLLYDIVGIENPLIALAIFPLAGAEIGIFLFLYKMRC